MNRLIVLFFGSILALLDKLYMFRKRPYPPPYPYDKATDTITLPVDIETRICRMAAAGNKVDAVKETSLLTGAGLRVSKRYVDNLIATRK
jgi:hypothetical protein